MVGGTGLEPMTPSLSIRGNHAAGSLPATLRASSLTELIRRPAGISLGAVSESGGGGTKRFRPVPTLGALAHHLEEVAQSLAVDVDLDVVAQRGRRVVEGDVDSAKLGAEVLR